MNTSVTRLIPAFTLSNPEIEKFEEYLQPFLSLIDKYIDQLSASLSREPPRLIKDASIAFKEVLARTASFPTSDELAAFYKSYIENPMTDAQLNEVIVDTIYDIARFRGTSRTPSAADAALFAQFSSYHSLCETMHEFVEGVMSTMLDMHELADDNFEKKRLHIVKGLLPILTEQAKELKKVWHTKIYDDSVLRLILYLKDDLTLLDKSNQSRLRSFFSVAEYDRIIAMSHEQAEAHFASLALENLNMREVKSLYRFKEEIHSYLTGVLDFISALEIDQKDIDAFVRRLESDKKDKLTLDATTAVADATITK